MTLIQPLDAPYPEGIQTDFDRIMPPGIEPLLLFRTIATSSRAWAKFTRASLLDEGPLELRQRELAILRTCALKGSEYEWGVHAALFAAAASITSEELARTAATELKPGEWPVRDAALLAAVDALCSRATLDPPERRAIAEHFSSDQILEILMLVGFYHMVAFLTNGLALANEAWAAGFPTQS